MTANPVLQWLNDGELELPAPGSGGTGLRWETLAALTERDVVAGRLAEAHTDAIAILAELDASPPDGKHLWGVWAAEAPTSVLKAAGHGDRVRLSGVKAWCSGAGVCSHALVTALRPDDTRGLYAVDLEVAEVTPLASDWHHPGMATSDTRSVRFDGAEAVAVGAPGRYLTRPGFWHGAIGVAACWIGGARAVAAPLYRAVGDANGRSALDEHAHAHLGAVDAALAAAEAVLWQAAARIDARPGDDAELIARRVRAVAESAVEAAISRTGRALGPGPLVSDAVHAKRVLDLGMYVRQSHAERDLAALGRAAAR